MKNELSPRLLQFGKDLVSTVQKSVQLNYVNQNIVENLIKSGTNFGIDYMQANSASSKKAFIYKMNVSRNQINEVVYRLEMLIETDTGKKSDLQKLITEAKELSSIFNKITWTLKKQGEKEEVLVGKHKEPIREKELVMA